MTRLALILSLVGLGLVAGRAQEGAPVEEPAARPPAEAAPPAEKAVSPEEAAIREVVAEFVRAFNAGDAPAIAALFTEDARIQTEGDDAVAGREAIQNRYAELFELGEGRTIAIHAENLRMLGSEAAIEEGIAVVEIPANDEEEARVASTRYSVAYVKKDGKWLQDSVHDYPVVDHDDVEISAHERLKDLEWLIGEWVDERDEGEIHTECHWSEDGAFLIRRFGLKLKGDLTASGVQRIGWDPRRGRFRSWTFDSEGGFADGFWAVDGDRWVIKTEGVLSDGQSASATNIVTREGDDVIRWASIDRTVGAAVLPDAETVTLVRKPPEPAPAEAPRPEGEPQ